MEETPSGVFLLGAHSEDRPFLSPIVHQIHLLLQANRMEPQVSVLLRKEVLEHQEAQVQQPQDEHPHEGAERPGKACRSSEEPRSHGEKATKGWVAFVERVEVPAQSFCVA